MKGETYEGVGRSVLVAKLLHRDAIVARAREFVAAFDALRARKHDCGGHVELSVSPTEWALCDRLQNELDELLEKEIAP